MGRRKLVAPLYAVAVMTAGVLTSTVPAADAQQARPDATVMGNFSGGPDDEAFLYRAGTGSDHLVRFSTGGVPDGPLTWQVFHHMVSGSYRPVAGDFDADGYDEILWYAPGAAQDSLWDFTGDTTRTSQNLTIGGVYQPVAGDFDGNGYDDVFWYGPEGRDFVWLFRSGGYDSVERPVSYPGFRPVAGSFGVDHTDDVFFHAPGPAPDYLWDLHPDGSHTSTAYAVAGGYEVFSLDAFGQDFGGEDIYFYAEGSTNHYVWDFVAGQRTRVIPEAFQVGYTPGAGNLLGDPCDDIVFAGATGVVLQNFQCGENQSRLYVVPDLTAR